MKNFAVLTLTLLVLTVLPSCIVISSQKSYKPDQHAQPDQCRNDSDRTSVMAQIDTALKLQSDIAKENVLIAIASRPDLSETERSYLTGKITELPSSIAQENVLMALVKNTRPPKCDIKDQPKPAPQLQPQMPVKPDAPTDANK